jgi:WD domain, G-beta repeat
MDGSVRIWSLKTGQLLHTLTGHTSLVGLLSLSPTTLVSAAADSTLRIWDPTTGALQHTLSAHTGAITCFQHDEFKVLSGSDGALKMWDTRDGTVIRDLLINITGVWQVVFDERFCVAASNAQEHTYLDVWDFGSEGDDDVEAARVGEDEEESEDDDEQEEDEMMGDAGSTLRYMDANIPSGEVEGGVDQQHRHWMAWGSSSSSTGAVVDMPLAPQTSIRDQLPVDYDPTFGMTEGLEPAPDQYAEQSGLTPSPRRGTFRSDFKGKDKAVAPLDPTETTTPTGPSTSAAPFSPWGPGSQTFASMSEETPSKSRVRRYGR